MSVLLWAPTVAQPSAPSMLTQARWAVSDSLMIAKRNLLVWLRVPAYLVFHNTTLEEIAARRPRSLDELAAVPGVGPAKLERYGQAVLGMVDSDD